MNNDHELIGTVVTEVLSRLKRWQETPEGRAHRAHAERFAEERRRRELVEIAEGRGLVADAAVLGHALERDLTGPLVDAVRSAYAWRSARRNATRTVLPGAKVPAVLLLSSPPGLGKTVALSWAVLHAERSAWYTTATEITATPRNGFSDNETRWRRWERCELLAIDELGLESQPEEITRLLLARWSAGGITLLASNLARKDFLARYADGALGDRLTDRLGNAQQRIGLDWCVQIKGASRRAQIQGAR